MYYDNMDRICLKIIYRGETLVSYAPIGLVSIALTYVSYTRFLFLVSILIILSLDKGYSDMFDQANLKED